MTAETAGVNPDTDLVLATGGDLSRKRDGGAASAGTYLVDMQVARTTIFDKKIVDHLGSL